jgi:hypothetical protein
MSEIVKTIDGGSVEVTYYTHVNASICRGGSNKLGINNIYFHEESSKQVYGWMVNVIGELETIPRTEVRPEKSTIHIRTYGSYTQEILDIIEEYGLEVFDNKQDGKSQRIRATGIEEICQMK